MELEEKCLQWLLDNSDEIIEANNKLDEVLSDMSAIDAGLHNFSEEMTKYMAAVMSVESETAILTREMNRREDMVQQLKDYLDSIVLTTATETGLRNSCDPSTSQFWIFMTELANKLESVKRLSAEAMQNEIDRQRRNSLSEGRGMIDSESASISEVITTGSKNILENTLSSEGPSLAGSSLPSIDIIAPPPPPPQRHSSRYVLNRRYNRPSLRDAESALREVETVARERIYQHVTKQIQKAFGSRAPLQSARCHFMSQTKRAYDYLISSGLSRWVQNIRERYTQLLAEVHKQATQTYFKVARDQINKAEYSMSDLQRGLSSLGFAPFSVDIVDRNTPKILAGAADPGLTASSSGLFSLLVNSVLPQQHGPSGPAIRRNTIPAAQSATGEINSIYGTIEEIKQRFLIMEDVFRSNPSLSEYRKSGMRVQPEELLKLMILAVMETGTDELQFIDSYFCNVNSSADVLSGTQSFSEASKPRSERDSLPTPKLTKNPPQVLFERVFSSSLNESRSEILRQLIHNNYDLVSLLIMKQIIEKYLAAMNDLDWAFAENMLTNIFASVNKQFERTFDNILMTISHENKPVPQSNSEMFVRQGFNDGCQYIPSPSTTKTLMESLVILALGKEEEGVGRVQRILQGLHENVDLDASEKKLDLCGNVHYIITLLEDVDLPESAGSQISDLSTWATSFRARLTEAMAVEVFNSMRPDLVQTVQAAEAQLKTDGAVGDSTRIKLAKFTNTDFSGDLRRLASIFSKRKLVFGMTMRQMNELTNDILTKYLVLHTRFRDVLVAASVPVSNLITPDTLMAELKDLEDATSSN